MLAHHFVTLSLIYCSFKVGYIEYGVMVLFSMDLCDVFLEVCPSPFFPSPNPFPSSPQLTPPPFFSLPQLLRALRRVCSLPDWAETLLFLPLPISWFLLRLWFYCRSILTHTILMIPIISGWQVRRGEAGGRREEG